MLKNSIYIRFVDGAAVTSGDYTGSDCECFQPQPKISHDWFDALVIVHPNDPTTVQSSVASSPWEDYIPELVADFWSGVNTNKPYWRTWKITLRHGATEYHSFTAHHQVDAARSYQLLYPFAQVVAVTGHERRYLALWQRSLIDANPFEANKPISDIQRLEI